MPLTTAGTIGSITCHGWRGTIAAARNVVDTYSRPGVNFSGFQVLARRAPSSQVQTVTVSTSTVDAAKVRKDAEAMVGTVVKVVDPFGREWPSVRIDDVTVAIMACRGMSPISGTQAAARVEITWTMEAQE